MKPTDLRNTSIMDFASLDEICQTTILNFTTCKDFFSATGTHKADECDGTCKDAAKKDHINCLVSAHKNGGFWGAETCELAAENNHIDCLRYAHENGCPWDEDTS